MMTLQEIRQALQDRRTDKVAEGTGLHYNTVREVRDNQHANPTYRTLSALSAYIQNIKEADNG